MTETTFVLCIDRDQRDPGHWRVRAQAHQGTGFEEKEEAKIAMPSRAEWAPLLRQVQDALVRDADRMRRVGAPVDAPGLALVADGPTPVAGPHRAMPEHSASLDGSDLLREFGGRLFGLVFETRPGKLSGVGKLYREAKKRADDPETGSGMRLRLLVDPALEVALPWEALFDKETGHSLCASRGMYSARALAMDQEDPLKPGARPISILGMATRAREAGGLTLDELDVAGEREAMEKALSEQIKAGAVRLAWTNGGDPDTLDRSLDRPPNGVCWSVFHFIGHGGFGDGGGYLVMDHDDSPRGRAIKAGDLIDSFTGPKAPRLVVLNACRGAQADPDGKLASTAATLVKGGVRAVVAMQFNISDTAAIRFSSSLYRSLAEGEPLQAAVANARRHLKRHSLEWITPVLLMRTRDGHIIRDPGVAAGPAP